MHEEEYEESMHNDSVLDSIPLVSVEDSDCEGTDLLNDDDQDYIDFIQRKNTIVENINKFSSAYFPQNSQKRKDYMNKVNQAFKEE